MELSLLIWLNRTAPSCLEINTDIGISIGSMLPMSSALVDIINISSEELTTIIASTFHVLYMLTALSKKLHSPRCTMWIELASQLWVSTSITTASFSSMPIFSETCNGGNRSSVGAKVVAFGMLQPHKLSSWGPINLASIVIAPCSLSCDICVGPKAASVQGTTARMDSLLLSDPSVSVLSVRRSLISQEKEFPSKSAMDDRLCFSRATWKPPSISEPVCRIQFFVHSSEWTIAIGLPEGFSLAITVAFIISSLSTWRT